MDPCADLLPQLLDFDEAQRQRVFDAKVFCCGICFSEKLGSSCLCFKECQHVYCKACMTEYFQIQIRDGNVQCLNCPEPKCTSLATPLQVRDICERRCVKLLIGHLLACNEPGPFLRWSSWWMKNCLPVMTVCCSSPVWTSWQTWSTVPDSPAALLWWWSRTRPWASAPPASMLSAHCASSATTACPTAESMQVDAALLC